MNEWFLNESFWETFFPYLFSEERTALGAVQAEQAVALAGLAGLDKGRVLDLCCGPGRVAIPLARKGFRVTGVDRSPFLLDKARQAAQAQGVDVEWVQEDMRSFTRPESFSLALNLFTSFGYFTDPNDDIQVLANLCACLVPGGTLVMELMCKERLARIWQPTISETFGDGSLLVHRVSIQESWKRVHAEWVLVRDGRAETFTFEHSLYSGRELEDRLLQVGFTDIALFGDLDAKEFGVDAERLVIVARKPGSS